MSQASDGAVSKSGNSHLLRGMIAGLEPINFITLATPHLGVRGRKQSGASNSSNNSNLAKKKCFLIDCSGSGEKVAEGKVISTNPSDTVHCHPLGPNASKVWVEVCLIGDAQVWRQTSEFQIVADALGTTIAWPNENIVYM